MSSNSSKWSLKSNLKFYLTTLSLILFFSVVIYEIYKSSNQDNKKKETQIFDRKILDALEFEIQAGQKLIKITKGQDGWKIKAPLEDFVSETLMKEILNDIFNAPTENLSASEVTDWNKYGLGDPVGQVQIKGPDGYLLNISVSQTKSYDGDTYLKLAKTKDGQQNDFLLVSKMNWLDLILKSPLDFVNKKNVFKIDGNSVKMIDVSDLGVFSKKDGLWSFETSADSSMASTKNTTENGKKAYNIESEIDPAKAEKILQLLMNLNVFEFESKKTLKLVKTLKSLTVLMTNAEKIEVSIFDHYKQCGDAEKVVRCQLMSSSQAEHPFWVLEPDIISIIKHQF